MAGRFDLRPLIQGVREGLRRRRASGPEPADWGARRVLLIAPGIVLVASIAVGGGVSAADPLLAGTALLIGGLLAAFSQLASWRERLLARERKVDRRRIRALDEAGAHILWAVVVSVGATVDLVILANLDVTNESPLWLAIAGRVLGAVGAAVFAYLALTLVLVTNLLWDAYQDGGDSSTSHSVGTSRKRSD